MTPTTVKKVSPEVTARRAKLRAKAVAAGTKHGNKTGDIQHAVICATVTGTLVSVDYTKALVVSHCAKR